MSGISMNQKEYLRRSEEQRALKNAKKRALAAETRSRVAAIQNIPKDMRTLEEQRTLTKYEERRARKNVRSRNRVKECKAEVDRILAMDEQERTKEEQAYLDLNLDRRLRKNLADRLRRKMKKAEKSQQLSVDLIAERDEKSWGGDSLKGIKGNKRMLQQGKEGIAQIQANNTASSEEQLLTLARAQNLDLNSHLYEKALIDAASSSILNQYAAQQYAKVLPGGLSPLLEQAKIDSLLHRNPLLTSLQPLQVSNYQNQNDVSSNIRNICALQNYQQLIKKQQNIVTARQQYF